MEENPTKLTVSSFTVSWSLGGYRGSEKSDSFVSATIQCNPPIGIDDLPLTHIKAALKVSAAVIQDSVARQTISENEAVDRLSSIKENFLSIEKAMLRARETKETKDIGHV